MYPEQGLVLHGVERAVETLVVLVFQRARGLHPKGLHCVDDVVGVGVHHLAVFPFLLLAEGDGYRHKQTVFAEQFFYLALLKEFLAVVSDVKDDVAAAVFFLGVYNLKGGTAVAAPLHGLGVVAVAAGHNLHFLAHHEGAVET